MGTGVTAAILAQADGRVGTGHLRESLAVADALIAAGGRAHLWTNAGAPSPFFTERPELRRLISLAPATLSLWAKRAAREGARVILANLWDPAPAQVRALRAGGLPLVVMDEVGGKALAADLIVNPLLIASRTRYPGSRARVLRGLAWLALDASYARAERRPIRGPLRTLLVTFGGVDRTGATIRAVRLLAGWRPEARKIIVLGPGFAHDAALKKTMSRFPSAGLEIVRGAKSLKALIVASDAVLTAGGNTLCEAACLGISALVAHEDPHERLQGRAFEKAGFARCLGPGRALTGRILFPALASLDDPARRRRRADAGRRLVDGLGAGRLARLLEETAVC